MILRLAGVRYWTASLLPALVGTTLPLWLRPPGFSFRWIAAGVFLLATVLLHAGFSFLLERAGHVSDSGWPGSALLAVGGACITVACLLGLYLSRSVPGSIFIVYGLSVVFTGLLYAAPPFNFWCRAGGEVVLAAGLGLMPVLGAYLVQVGDLTRTVYLAAVPLVAVTGLWVWVAELASAADDKKDGRETMVILFGTPFSGRVVVPALLLLTYVGLLGAVLTESLMPLVLTGLLTGGFAWRVAAESWSHYASQARMLKARWYALLLHLSICSIIAASSLFASFR